MACMQRLRDSRRLRTWVTTISCMLLMMCLSAISYFGAIINYFYSYYRSKSIHLIAIDPLWMLTAYQSIAPVGMNFGSPMLSKRIGDFRSIVFFATIFAGSAFASFFSIQEPLGLLLTFGVVQGFCSGALFNLAWKICMKSTQHKGSRPGQNFAGGIISCGTPISALLVSEMALLVVNPFNEVSDLTVENAKYFTQPDILDRVPCLFIMQGCLCTLVHSVGISMLYMCLRAEKLAGSTYCAITEEAPALPATDAMVSSRPVLPVNQSEEDQSGLIDTDNVSGSNTEGRQNDTHNSSSSSSRSPGLRQRSNSSRGVTSRQRRPSGKQTEGEDSHTPAELSSSPPPYTVLEHEDGEYQPQQYGSVSPPGAKNKTSPNSSHLDTSASQKSKKADISSALVKEPIKGYTTFVNQQLPKLERRGSLPTEPASTDLLPRDAVKTPKFWLLWIISLMLNVTCFVFANLYKECGQVYLNNDALTTNAGVLSNVFMIGVRPLFGKFVDLKGVRDGLLITSVGCTVFIVLTMGALQLASGGLFMLCVVLEINAIATIWPFTNYAAREAFGMSHYGEITALLFTALMPPYLVLPVVLPSLIKAMGWMYVLLLAELASFIAFFLGFLYDKL